MSGAHAPGTLCWVDLGTADPARAARFYGGLLGWEAAAAGEDGYTLCRLDGRLVAGLPADDQVDPWWTTNVSTDDVARSAAAVTAAGGSVYAGPATLGLRGRFASATDPAGTKILLWEPLRDHGVEVQGVIGAWVGTTLFTAAWAQVQGFYAAAFGWRGDAEAGDVVALCTAGGRPVATVAPLPQGWPEGLGARWVPFFGVPRLEEATARAQALGARRVIALAARRRSALVVDDQGVLFGLTVAPPGT